MFDKMYQKNVMSVLYLTLFIISWCDAVVEGKYILDQHRYESLGFIGKKPTFSKKIYIANIDGISLELEGAISLDNCHAMETFFEIDTSYADYLPLTNNKSLVLGSNCTLFFPKIFIKNKPFTDDAFAGFITVKAIYNKYVLDVTSIILMPRSNTKNLKMIFEVDGVEYIILNYFHLKVTFILVLVITFSILILEMKEVHDKFFRFRYRNLETYI
ncbi:uncharacterized protein LOC130448705 [Diorhabda sublineata]|nr:uncharacterized protein LOC130448705 [Diorhabda sublineata]